MRICWDMIEGIYLNRNGVLMKGTTAYIEKDKCDICGEPYLMQKYLPTKYCSLPCVRCGVNNSMYGVHLPSNKNGNWKGGVKKLGIPNYDTYGYQISYVEKIRKCPDNSNLLEARCTYCDRWFMPTTDSVQKRIKSLNGNGSGEGRLYCSDSCKQACPIYRQVKYPKGFKKATSREVQPELRQMVFKRDNYTCQYGNCGKTIEDAELHCHHIEGLKQNPIESADIDMCISLCKEHHKKIHGSKGCRYIDLICKEKNNE